MIKDRPLLTVSTILIASIITTLLWFNQNRSTAKKQHQLFIDNHHFQRDESLSKKERRHLGLPPNEYLEQEYILEMNPVTGITEVKKLFEIQESLRNGAHQRATPGSSNLDRWQERGPNDKPGRTRAMLYDPNDPTHKRVFAGDVRGGLWVNHDIEDENEFWQRVDISENLAVSTLTSDPNDSNILYLGTGESYTSGSLLGNGIWKSTDGGTSWNHIFGGNSGEITTVNDAIVTVNMPESITGNYIAIQSDGFGSGLTESISGDLVLVDDGSENPSEACNDLVNAASINGNIAVLDRGGCGFTTKVKNAQEAGAIAVNDYSEKGYDFIKIYDGLQAEQFGGIVSEADEKGIVVAGHLPYDVDIKVLLNSNFNSFEHVEELLHFIDEEKTEKGMRHLAKQLKIAGKTVTINLLAFNRIYKTVMEGQAYFDQLERKGINPLIIFIGEKQLSEYVHAGPKYKALTQTKYEAMQNFARILAEENVDVVLGTDSGPNLIPAGSSVLEEMKLLQEAGLSNGLILKSATAAVAKVRNQSNSGQIAVGNTASFVLLDENPLQNINTFNSPFGVLKNNIWYDKEKLQKLRKLGQEKSTIYMTLGRFFDHLIRL